MIDPEARRVMFGYRTTYDRLAQRGVAESVGAGDLVATMPNLTKSVSPHDAGARAMGGAHNRFRHSLTLGAVQKRLDQDPQAMRRRRETVEHPLVPSYVKVRRCPDGCAILPSVCAAPQRSASDPLAFSVPTTSHRDCGNGHWPMPCADTVRPRASWHRPTARSASLMHAAKGRTLIQVNTASGRELYQ